MWAFLPLVGAVHSRDPGRMSADAAPPQGTGVPPRRIGILLFDGVEELDAVGPWEVLAH